MVKQNHPELDYSAVDNFEAQQYFTVVRAHCPDCDFIPQYDKFGENMNKVHGYFSVYFPDYDPDVNSYPNCYNSIFVDFNACTHEYMVCGGFYKNKRYIMAKFTKLEEVDNFLKDVSLKKTI